MKINLKNALTLFAIATTLTLASCQSEPIEPKAAPAKKATTETPNLHTEDDDQPPKDTGKGGGNKVSK